jgi:hypothetical protein
MKVIWKFPIEVAHSQFIEMPKGAHILCVQYQATIRSICLWAVCDSDEQEKENVEIAVCGTGHPIPTTDFEYIGTAQDLNYFVWHVFKINHYETPR